MRAVRSGTTLLEVLIASTILGVALVSFFGIMVSGQTLGGFSREGTLAACDLQSAVEDTFSVPFASVQQKFPDGSTLGDYTNLNLRNEKIRIAYLEVQPDAITYRLEIEYTNFNGHRQTDAVVTRRAR